MRAHRLEFSGAARRDLREIREYLAATAGPRVAARMMARIRAAIAATREMPQMGTPRPRYRPNCRFIYEQPYVIYYDFDGHTMMIVRVLHRARDREAIMGSPPPET